MFMVTQDVLQRVVEETNTAIMDLQSRVDALEAKLAEKDKKQTPKTQKA